MKDLNNKGCSLLCNAIVLQAVQDYRKVLRGHRIKRHVSVSETKKELKKFFESEWFGALTKINGTYLMQKLEEEYINESNAYPKYKQRIGNNL